MKTLVTRSLALLLTLALLFTMMPFMALADAVENDDWMDEGMNILEPTEVESESADGAGKTPQLKIEEQPMDEETLESTETIGNYEPETDLSDESADTFLPDVPETPGVEDDWTEWYTDDSSDEEPAEENGDVWFEDESDSFQDLENEQQEDTESLSL